MMLKVDYFHPSGVSSYSRSPGLFKTEQEPCLFTLRLIHFIDSI